MDEQGQVRARYDYDPYGRVTKLSGDRDSLFLYTGHLWHAQSGLFLTQFRAYDPELGRWISRDPIKENGGINLYAYVMNNPISLIDPLGLSPWGSFAWNFGISFVVAAVVAAVAAVVLAPVAAAIVGAIAVGLLIREYIKLWEMASDLCVSDDEFYGRAGAWAGGAIGGFLGGMAGARFGRGGGADIAEAMAEAPLETQVGSDTAITAEAVQAAITDSPMLATQPRVSLPRIQEFALKMRAGEEFPPIQTDGQMIVNGHHRFIAGEVIGKPVATRPGTVPSSQVSSAYPIGDITIDSIYW